MAHKPKPHVHGRDHEHGGADPTWTHWQDTAANTGKFGKIVFGDNLTVTPDSSDNRLIRVDATGGGGGLATFAITGDGFSSSTYDTPLILDTPQGGESMHFYSSDAATFDSSAGRVRILRPGMYVIGCQMNISFTGTTDGIAVWLRLEYGGGAGSSIEVPWYVGGFEEVRGTRYDYVFERTYSDTDVALQRLHPISLTASAGFPLEILPTYDAHYTAAEAIIVGWVAVWGFRVGEPLDSYHSN